MPRTTEVDKINTQTCLYDSLLEKFLPIIHKAARSVCNGQPSGFSGDLLVAGLRGLKDAFLHGDEMDQDISAECVTHCIYASMRQQIQVTTLN